MTRPTSLMRIFGFYKPWTDDVYKDEPEVTKSVFKWAAGVLFSYYGSRNRQVSSWPPKDSLYQKFFMSHNSTSQKREEWHLKEQFYTIQPAYCSLSFNTRLTSKLVRFQRSDSAYLVSWTMTQGNIQDKKFNKKYYPSLHHRWEASKH